jgi:probable addiction module antidote protein
MMARNPSVYDPAEDLTSAEAIAIFLTEAFKTEDAGYIAHALGVVARARGMADIARRTGLSRAQLYRSFSAAGNPRLRTILAVMNALGVELSARPPARRSRSQHQGKRAA